MKIVLALHRPLFPTDRGARVRSLNLFQRLAKRIKIHVVSPADPVSDAEAISKMEQIFQSCTPICWQEAAPRSPRFYFELFTNQFCRLPYSIAKCIPPEFGLKVQLVSRREEVDLVLCDFLHTAPAVLGWSATPKVVFEHNVEFQLRKRQWFVETNTVRKHVFAAEWRKTHAIESEVCRTFDHVITVSEEDRETLKREFCIPHVSAIPTGVDADFYHPWSVSPRPRQLVFVGSMDWHPNEDAMIWFVEEIYPRIRQQVSHARLTIVGRSPSLRLRKAVSRDASIHLTNWVPDVRPYLAEAEVVVVPLRIGGGTRIKIPEAMAMEKPVVSTSLGAEGLGLTNNRDIKLADQSQEFADAVIELLSDSVKREQMGRAARTTVLQEHSWEAAVDKFEEILESVMCSPQCRPGTRGRYAGQRSSCETS